LGSTVNQVDPFILVNDGDKYPSRSGIDNTALGSRRMILLTSDIKADENDNGNRNDLEFHEFNGKRNDVGTMRYNM